jgi:flagellar protein FlaJ
MDMKKRFLLFSYKFSKISLGRKTTIASLFTDLSTSLGKAGLRISFKAYVGLLSVTSIIVGVGTLGGVFLILTLFGNPIFVATLFSFGFGLLGATFTTAIFYFYPKLMASSRANKIDANIPHIANYMSILASAGVTPEKMFHSLARAGKDLQVEREAKMVVRDIELMGVDLFTALRTASDKTSSKKLGGLFEGIIASAHSGGDLSGYLRTLSARYMKEKRIQLTQFLDTLAVISEVYITFMVAAPLLLIVMLSVLSFLGGGIGSLDPIMILYLMAYIGLPIGVTFILIMLDAIIPPW